MKVVHKLWVAGRATLPAALALAATAFLAPRAWAGDRTWNGNASANWNTPSNWTPALVPGSADRARIPVTARAPVISLVPPVLGQLEVQTGATLTVNSGLTLTISGNTNPVIDGVGTVATLGTGQVLVTNGPNNGTLINDSITLGNFTLNAPIGKNFGTSSAKNIRITGNFTLTASEMRVGAAAGAASTLEVDGNLLIGAFGELELRAAGSTFRLGGNWTQTGRWQAGTGTTVILDGAGNQTIDVERNQTALADFVHLRVSNPLGTVTFFDNSRLVTGFVVTNNLTVDAGSRFVVQDSGAIGTTIADTFLIGSGATVTFQNQFDPDCTLSFVDGGANDGTLVLQGAALPPNDTSDLGFAFVAGAGTVRLQTSASGTFNLTDGGPYTFHNLEIDTDAGTGLVGTDVITAGAGFTVANNLILTEGQLALDAVTVTVAGNVDSSAAPASLLQFTAAGTLQVQGNVDLDAYSPHTFSTLLMNGTAPQTFQLRATTASGHSTVTNFRASNPAGITVLDNPNANFRATVVLTLDANALLTVRDTFDEDGLVLFAAGGGNVLRLEGLVVADTTIFGYLLVPGTGTVIYGANSLNQTVHTRGFFGTISYYNLTIDNSNGFVATQEALGLLSVSNNFTILGAGSIFTAGPGNMNVGANFTCNGTFNALTHTVSMTGTGSIGGTSPSLAFYNLIVNGATTSVVTAARSFSTGNTFQVAQGTLATLGAAAPITMSALLGFTAGNGAGAAGTAILGLAGPDVLAIQPGQTFTVNGTDGRFDADSNANGTPTLTRIGGSGAFSTMVDGQVNIRRLNFSYGDAQGLRINNATSASILRLSGISFSGIFPAAGSRYLTINSAGVDVTAPGCFFAAVPGGSFNVRAVDTAPGGTEVRVRLENRGTAPVFPGGGGPGAGEAFDDDDDTDDNGVVASPETSAAHGGAIVQWVYTANIDLAGSVQGFPMPAFDWSTFVYYSTYVVTRDASGTADRLYVLDSEGDVKGYSFTTPAGLDIVGPIFWDSEGADHVVYLGANDTANGIGHVFKLVDTGAGFTTVFDFTAANLTEVTSPIISDQVNLYFGGRNGATNGVYKVLISGPSMPNPPISTTTRRISTAPSWSDSLTGRSLFLASNAVSGVSNIYRVHVPTWSIDASLAGTSSFVAITHLPLSTLYVGDLGGRMYGVDALGTPASFLNVAGYPFSDALSPIQGGAVFDFFTSRLFFGDDAGNVYTLMTYTAPSWTLGTDYFRLTPLAGVPVRTMPLYLSGSLYVSNTAGQLFVVDANDGAGGQGLTLTWTLSNGALSDVSRDFNTGRIYVGTAAGRLLSVPETADPTPTFP